MQKSSKSSANHAIKNVLKAEKEVSEGKILRGDLDELAKKVNSK